MKCLTLREPWAALIFHGKDVESRSWPTPYRGPLAIHAGLSIAPPAERDHAYEMGTPKDSSTSRNSINPAALSSAQSISLTAFSVATAPHGRSLIASIRSWKTRSSSPSRSPPRDASACGTGNTEALPYPAQDALAAIIGADAIVRATKARSVHLQA